MIACMSCKCPFLKARFEGVKKNKNGTTRSNHKQLKTFSKNHKRKDMCNTSIVVFCVLLVMTFESRTHKLKQYFLVRIKNHSFDEFVCEVQQVEDFDLNCFLGTVFILTSQSWVHSSNVRLLLLPEMWGYFCVKTKGNVIFTQQQMQEKCTLFLWSLMIGRYLSFFQFCFVG